MAQKLPTTVKRQSEPPSNYSIRAFTCFESNFDLIIKVQISPQYCNLNRILEFSTQIEILSQKPLYGVNLIFWRQNWRQNVDFESKRTHLTITFKILSFLKIVYVFNNKNRDEVPLWPIQVLSLWSLTDLPMKRSVRGLLEFLSLSSHSGLL